MLAAAAAYAASAVLRLPGFGISPQVATAAALVFALHPVASSCVYPISSGRETLLPSLLTLAAMTVYVRPGLESYLGAVGLFAAALFSKEQAIVFPALILLADALA